MADGGQACRELCLSRDCLAPGASAAPILAQVAERGEKKAENVFEKVISGIEHISRPTRAPYLLVWGPQADGINSQTRAALRLEPWEPTAGIVFTGPHGTGLETGCPQQNVEHWS
ncbi:hypothetical protein N8I77_009463 [Diaporthe amygdali]|uniref:Uncharacterized protein n=1 Tax=Phomopsis amygdali TaxID=1214568 RepID=A0AAD9SB33_PHOAM|nr:hypothetical protein N8I77_009463 [Diaporthe amygdali]